MQELSRKELMHLGAPPKMKAMLPTISTRRPSEEVRESLTLGPPYKRPLIHTYTHMKTDILCMSN
jgi:hypothetical protein